MLESICHPNITQFIGVCSKPVAIMMDYECFDFSPFGLNHQMSNLLKFVKEKIYACFNFSLKIQQHTIHISNFYY